MDHSQALKNLAMQNDKSEKKTETDPMYYSIAHKAGMQKADKQKVSAVIDYESAGSRYYKKQVEKQEKCEEELEKKKAIIENFKNDFQQMQSVANIVQKKMADFEKKRNLANTWVHFDMDMFFVACELRDQPDLEGKPVVVGTNYYINTANYVARQYGVMTAMPGFLAVKLCPNLVFIPPNREKYVETSKKFKDVICQYDPDYESGGLDEAVLNLTPYLDQHNIHQAQDIEALCQTIRMKVNQETGITCSCGIGPNKLLAKLSTEINKPNGQFYMIPDKDQILTFLSKLPVRKIAGVGGHLEKLLNGLGVHTCQDIINRLSELFVAFPEGTFDFLLESALGIGSFEHKSREERDKKSLNASRVFGPTNELLVIQQTVQDIAGSLSQLLKENHKKAKHLTLLIKSRDFDIKTRSFPLDHYTDSETEINTICQKLLKTLIPFEPLKHITIKGGDLTNSENLQTLEKLFHRQSSLQKSESSDFDQLNPGHEIKGSQTVPPDLMMGQVSSKALRSGNEPQKDEPKVQEIFCPVCNMKFDSLKNNASINNHIDKCLQGISESFVENKSQGNLPEQALTKAVLEKGDKSAANHKKRAENPSSEQNNDLKKTKKTQNAGTLDKFFKKS